MDCMWGNSTGAFGDYAGDGPAGHVTQFLFYLMYVGESWEHLGK